MDGGENEENRREAREEAIKQATTEEKLGDIINICIGLAIFVTAIYISGLVISFA